MTDTTSSINSTKLTGYELKKEINSRFYRNKINRDPEFHEREKQRIREYLNNKYKNDPEFVEKTKARNKENYNRKKLANASASSTQSSESE
jgi:hypothetical protein